MKAKVIGLMGRKRMRQLITISAIRKSTIVLRPSDLEFLKFAEHQLQSMELLSRGQESWLRDLQDRMRRQRGVAA